MLRLRSAALASFLVTSIGLSGCLDPLSDDQPGYSRHLLPSGSEIPSAANDPAVNRKIDMNDGISMGKAPLKSGFANGVAVKYWDLGSGRGSASPAYQLARCDSGGRPTGQQPNHPLLVDALPGDAEYTQIWAIYYVCLTPSYNGELITNLSALSDAYELGMAIEPKEPLSWRHHPIVMEGVMLEGATDTSGMIEPLFVRGMRASTVDFGADGEVTPSMGKSVTTANVYEIVRPGSTKVERVVFGSLGISPEGTRIEGYAPIWTVVTATITADADITMFTKESDIATVNMDRTLTKASPLVVSVVATMNRFARPLQFSGGEL
jgi:hypothetical protein